MLAQPVACTVVAATTANTPSASKTVVDFDTEAESFTDIGFSIADPIYYQYEIGDSTDSCSHVGGENLYSFRAYGDLDGDSTTSTFELAAGSSQNNELMRAPGLYIENELE